MEKRKIKLIYELVISILSVIAVVFAIMDLTGHSSSSITIIDNVIWIIFVIDYITRFVVSNSKKYFVRNNIFDLIAIIPFNSAFRIFRGFKIFRLLKIAKLTKTVRFFGLLGRMYNKCNRFLNTNGFKYVLITSFFLIIASGTIISLYEGISLGDGLWWSIVTTTTVGYGDYAPVTTLGRIIACLLMFLGIGIIGSLTSTISAYFASDNPHSISNDKIKMVMVLYNELSDDEKDEFKKSI